MSPTIDRGDPVRLELYATQHKLAAALAAERGRAAALEWRANEEYEAWLDHGVELIQRHAFALRCEHRKRMSAVAAAKRWRARATLQGQDCDILEAASAHWQAECAKAERERDEARCMWAHDHGFGVEDERAYAAGMWGATEAERLFPEGK